VVDERTDILFHWLLLNVFGDVGRAVAASLPPDAPGNGGKASEYVNSPSGIPLIFKPGLTVLAAHNKPQTSTEA
jgi:hypothetical protein